MKAGDLFRNRKTGSTYRVVDPRVIDCTNATVGRDMVLYSSTIVPRSEMFVRDRDEFLKKFDPLHEFLSEQDGAGLRVCSKCGWEGYASLPIALDVHAADCWPAERRLGDLQAAQDKLCERLKGKPWLKGIGISPDVYPRIWVYVSDEAEASEIPDEVDGFPVGVRAVGAIRAAPDRPPPRSCNRHADCNRKPLGDPCCDDECCEECFGY